MQQQRVFLCVLHAIKLFLILLKTNKVHLCCRENDLEIVLPAESDDVDIDSSSIGNVCFDPFLCAYCFSSFLFNKHFWDYFRLGWVSKSIESITESGLPTRAPFLSSI